MKLMHLISQELQNRGVPSPAPLRSADYPLGIPGISGVNKMKVDKANELYRFTLCMLVFLDNRVAVSIENPFGSYLWAALVKLTMEHSRKAMALYNKLEMVRFHSCCHGSRRRKDTGWLSTPDVFKPLYAVCANDHTHEPWGVSWSMGMWKFDTSSEASYPSLLAQRAAACLVKFATSKGFILSPKPRLHDLSTASLGKQTKKELASNADEAASELLDLLGWRHARTGPKGKPFKRSFNVLGCSLSLDRVVSGEVVLENKQGRLERIFQQLKDIKTAKKMTLHQSQVLHGLLRYSCGFFAGKHMQQVCMEVLQLGRSLSMQSRGRLEEFCSYATQCLEACRPRRIRSGGQLKPILIFTDASWENQTAGLGAMVLDSSNGRIVIYAGQAPESKCHWLREVGDHLICQLELYVMVSLRWTLRNLLHDRRTIWWVDNEAARFSLIKGQSGSESMNKLVRQYFHPDSDCPTYSWIERVPSFSNPADAPSRSKPELAKEWFPAAELQPLLHDDNLVERLVTSAGWNERGKSQTS